MLGSRGDSGARTPLLRLGRVRWPPKGSRVVTFQLSDHRETEERLQENETVHCVMNSSLKNPSFCCLPHFDKKLNAMKQES